MSYNSELPLRTFLKPSEVAAFFRIALETVYFWHRMGKIEGIKIYGCLRIYRRSLIGIPRREADGRANIAA